MAIHEIIEKLRQRPKVITSHMIAGIATIIIVSVMTSVAVYVKLLETLDQTVAFFGFALIAVTAHTIIYTEIRKHLET